MSARERSKRLLVASLAGLPLCAVAIFLGIAFSGGGHGSNRLFLAALILCALDGLLLLLSVATGLQAERETPGSAPWLAVAIPLLLVAALVVIWGWAG